MKRSLYALCSLIILVSITEGISFTHNSPNANELFPNLTADQVSNESINPEMLPLAQTPTYTKTPKKTPTFTRTPTLKQSKTPSAAPTQKITPTPTVQPSKRTQTPTKTPFKTPVGTRTPTLKPSPTPTPSITPVLKFTATPTKKPSPTKKPLPTKTPTRTPTVTPTATKKPVYPTLEEMIGNWKILYTVTSNPGAGTGYVILPLLTPGGGIIVFDPMMGQIPGSYTYDPKTGQIEGSFSKFGNNPLLGGYYQYVVKFQGTASSGPTMKGAMKTQSSFYGKIDISNGNFTAEKTS